MKGFWPYRRSRSAESGYILLVVLLILALIMLATVAAAPRLAQQIRRDREEELIHRGTQYARAVKRFYKKFNRYPNSLADLEDTNHLRFLRRRFNDPMTESGEWRLIDFGEAKFPAKALSGAAGGQAGGIAGATPAGALGAPQTPPVGTPAAAMSTPAGGPTFGGGPMVGVASTSTQQSIKVLNERDHYNEWEFVYDPRLDLTNQQPQQLPGQPAPKPK